MKNRIGNLFGRMFAVLLCLSLVGGIVCPFSLSAYNDSRIVVGETAPLRFSESVTGGQTIEVSSQTPIIEKGMDILFAMPAEVALLVNALVAVDELGEERLDETFTVRMAEYPFVTDVGNLGIRDWSVVTYRDMLALMLLCRSQDAAAILAVQISGRYSSYLEKMNYRAGVLNMKSTTFLSVNGVYSEDQSISFSDITALLSAVSQNETIMNILSQTTYSVSESSSRLKKSYESLLPQTSVPGMVTAFCGESKEFGTVYACIDRRDFTVCTAFLFQDQQVQELILPISELHNTIYERYLVASAAEIAEVLAKDEKIRYYDVVRACYIQAVEYSPCVFLREIYEKAIADETFLKEMFSFDYQRNYIYSESREPGMPFAVAELRYGQTPICAAPLYVSDEVIEEDIPVSEPKLSFRQIYEEYPMYVLIAGGAAVLLILVLLILIFGRRKSVPETPDTVDEELLDAPESLPDPGIPSPDVSKKEDLPAPEVSPESSAETETVPSVPLEEPVSVEDPSVDCPSGDSEISAETAVPENSGSLPKEGTPVSSPKKKRGKKGKKKNQS